MASGKPAQIGVKPGQVFLGKYRVEKILGSGGMGIVAECTHLALGERVAIKMLRQDVLMDLDSVERFTREAQAAAKLKSEHVAHVSDVGRFEDGVPYMVMEFLEGLDLDQLLEQRGTLQVPWTVDLMLQTAEALAEAHSVGIVHRDIKPSNLFITWRPDGTPLVKVLDFGISKSAAGADMQLTQTQSLLGTPAYMSPEQMRSARLVDGRTDIWSLGTVMYEVLEGRKPFEAESFSEMCVKVAVDPPMVMHNTPLGLQSVVLRCLAKQPEQRYPSMAEFARDLIPFAQDQHGAAMLVERMFRTLRRSVPGGDAGGWEGLTTNSGNAVPQFHADARSAPVSAPHQPHQQHQQQHHHQQQQQGYIIPSSPETQQTLRSKPSRSWLPWVALIAAASVIGITVGVAMSRDAEEESRAEGANKGIVDPSAKPTDAVKPDPTVDPAKAVVDPSAKPTTIDPVKDPTKTEAIKVDPAVKPTTDPAIKKKPLPKQPAIKKVEPKAKPVEVKPEPVKPPEVKKPDPKPDVFNVRKP